MLEENHTKNDHYRKAANTDSSSSISAKANIHPSFIPSIVSSLNQTHVLSGGVTANTHCFSNTQPLTSFKSHFGGAEKS
jgi:hypothetical protein